MAGKEMHGKNSDGTSRIKGLQRGEDLFFSRSYDE